jgi:DNA transformation protein
MAVSDGYKAFLADLLSGFGPVQIRNMFGGAGVYADGVMFAILVDDTLYLKADETSAEAFAAEGKGPFTYRPKGRSPVAMSYWEIPERLLDDPDSSLCGPAAPTRSRLPPRRHGSRSAGDRRKAGYCSWMLCRYWMMASTSVGLNMKIGMSGCPETIPSASDSARSSTGYLRDKVRNGGAGGCGLSPVLPIAWQREQLSRSSTSPLSTRVLSAAWTGTAKARRIASAAAPRLNATRSLRENGTEVPPSALAVPLMASRVLAACP